jgi:hypothetical protein
VYLSGTIRVYQNYGILTIGKLHKDLLKKLLKVPIDKIKWRVANDNAPPAICQ